MTFERFVPVPSAVLAALRPNDVLTAKFREGYRCAVADAKGWQHPRGVHAYGANVKLVRALVARQWAGLEVVPWGIVLLTLELCAPDLTCDDDAWLFLVKPTLDGIADGAGWRKDRRRIPRIAGGVDREFHSNGLRVILEVPDARDAG